MLVYEENSDVFPFGELLKGSFDSRHLRLCDYVKNVSHLLRIGVVLTRVDDEKVLLASLDMTDAG